MTLQDLERPAPLKKRRHYVLPTLLLFTFVEAVLEFTFHKSMKKKERMNLQQYMNQSYAKLDIKLQPESRHTVE